MASDGIEGTATSAEVQAAIDSPGYHNAGEGAVSDDESARKLAEAQNTGIDTAGALPSEFDPPEVVAEREKQEKEAEAGKSGEADDAGKAKETEEAQAEGDATGAPEQYEPFEFPEGMDATNEERMGVFTELSKESNLGQEAAQKFITLAAEHTGEVVLSTTQQILQAQRDATVELHAQWEVQRREHPMLGGANYEASHAAANLAVAEIEKVLDLPLRDHLRATGMGNNPAIWGLLATAGQSLAPDTLPRGFRFGGRSQADADDGSRPTMYATDGIGSAEK